MHKPDRLTRLTAPGTEPLRTSSSRFVPSIPNLPSLPPIDWSMVGAQTPQLMASQKTIPKSSVIVMTWADPEWAAMEHVFCSSATLMAYKLQNSPSHAGWTKYTSNIPKVPKSPDWNYWGYFRQVQIGTSTVLLFKSNTHLDYPGGEYLTALIDQLIADVKPKLILSIGTAGGANPTDHIGTIQVVHAGTLYESNQPQVDWPTSANAWTADWSIIKNSQFNKLLFATPTKGGDLQSIVSQFNAHFGTGYSLADLNPTNLNMADSLPMLNNRTTGNTSLLTADSFLVATTAGNLEDFACVEMDDAVIADACNSKHIAFGFVRNISDPAQGQNLPARVQGDWGHAIYDVYGLYTSYNGALATWGIIHAIS